MRRPRHLSPDDRALWDQVRKSVTPLERGPLPQPEDVPVKPRKAKSGRAAPIAPFDVGSQADGRKPNDVLPAIGARLRAAPVQMDDKAYKRMTRGKLKPEARIDLHGMTMDQAHPALTEFILDAQAAGKRLVLVITGKGKMKDDGGPMPARLGVLRHAVPQWLRLMPLAPAVMEVRPAHLRHGGEGAYYVYLRKRR